MSAPAPHPFPCGCGIVQAEFRLIAASLHHTEVLHSSLETFDDERDGRSPHSCEHFLRNPLFLIC